MDLKSYFENTKGLGVLATADASGKVDVAVYARPHVIDEHNVAFIMADRLSHQNLQSNPKAAYLLVEQGPGYKGHRLVLTQLREDTDPKLIDSMRRKGRSSPEEDAPKYLVFFHIEEIRPIVGR
jgi:hypothetical protein